MLAGRLAVTVPLALLALLLPVASLAPAQEFNFQLIPKPFQRNPELEMTVHTDLTDFGRSLTPATPAQPVTYLANAKGYQPMGDTVGWQRPPLPAELEAILQRALGEQGYQPVASGQVPALMLIYYWGSHYRLDLEMARLFPELHRQHTLERAYLVGGRTYAKQVQDEMDFGFMPGDRSLKKGFLLQQADTDLYYVVVSAYEHASVLKGEPRLAWRTTMTVNAIGVAMKESLPPLILTAGPWFGRETADTLALRRTVKRGTVDLGPLRVIEGNVSLPPESKE